MDSSGNILTSTVNGISPAVNIINSNVLSLTGSDLVSTINGEASNTLSIASFAIEPWNKQTTSNKAIDNGDAIYQNGNVAIGTLSSTPLSTKKLDVAGDFKTVKQVGSAFVGLETNLDSGGPTNIMFSSNNLDFENATKMSASVVGEGISVISSKNTNAIASIRSFSEVGGSQVSMEALDATGTIQSSISGNNLPGDSKVSLLHAKTSAELSAIEIEKLKGVTFSFQSAAGLPDGYTFPRNKGLANQVLTTNGLADAQLSWTTLPTPAIADVRRIGTNHISEDAGVGSNGTTMPGTNNIAIGAGAMNAASAAGAPFGFLGNIAIGGGSQLGVVNGDGSVAIGYGNLPRATTGNNVAVGPLNLLKATTATANYVLGSQNLSALTTGGSNATMGANNLIALTTGSSNHVFGHNSLQKITTQSQNMAVGSDVLKNATGDKNIGVGSTALQSLGTGQDNVALGVNSGGALTTGNYNTFFGTEAGNRLAGSATDRYNSGDNSLFLGSQTKAKNTASSQLNIGNWIYGENGSVAFGNFTGATALPTIDPAVRLDVVTGNARVRTLNTTAYTLVATDKVVVANTDGTLKSVPASTLAAATATEPWNVISQPSGTQATGNGQNIYQMGIVAIGATTAPSFTIGTSPNQQIIQPKLHVAGDISTTGKVWTTNSVYADYVFEKYFQGNSEINPNYEFKSLNYVKDFIKTNNHLPGVESINDLNKADNGYTFDMTKLAVQSLEKIEELYLHTIEQEHKIDAQQSEIDKLKKESEETNKRLERLEQLLSNNR